MSDATSAPESRVIRVFLSSTFRDFMEERDLLVKQVFPELRRKARERGIDVVDVDLRWGITEEESRQGKVIPICLGEIDRCRPYFVGMLGERYGWIPPADQYSPEVIERQPWLKDHLGGVSVTELEILHGVLNDPAIAGRAFFYFRDPAWSASQSEPGFVCETPEEETKLADLKQRIHTSGFPVAENIPDPKDLADRIGHDLWELIDHQYPDLEEADALEREERQHASYRRTRLGVYLGGKRSINQLERWIDAGHQKILITGESGAGKSALIANWIEAHQQRHPEDVVFAHHLGCSNDASAIRPLLARLIDTAKQQLPEIYGYSLSVPQDWWELVAKAVEALRSLGRWAQQNNHRWILVLDGLDRLDSNDQNAIPWVPLTIPDGVVIVASALECPAREILLERKFKTLTIGPLKAKEQDALIQQYLGRYTKQLIAELRQTILSHPLAGSPLFLRVLLEELRQCGRYETLAEQLSGYLSAETIDDLYERVLERLEVDGNGENVRKVMTALWASRAGLSEEELLAITGLKPLQWAPIDLALEEALGRNGNRLVFDHDYLRLAVEDRYLTGENKKCEAHGSLADWLNQQDEWNERLSEERPWQLLKANRLEELRELLLNPWLLAKLSDDRSAREVASFWIKSRRDSDSELDELIQSDVLQVIDEMSDEQEAYAWFIDRIADVIEEAGLHRDLLLRLRTVSLKLEEASSVRNEKSIAISLRWLGDINREMGFLKKAEEMYRRSLTICKQLLGNEHPDTLSAINGLAKTLGDLGDQEEARAYYKTSLEASIRLHGLEHPDTLTNMNNLALLLVSAGDFEEAESLYKECLEIERRILGEEDPGTLMTISNLGILLAEKRVFDESEKLLISCLEAQKRVRGHEHPDTLTTMHNLGVLFKYAKDYDRSIPYIQKCLEISKRLQGAAHPDTITTMMVLGDIYSQIGDMGMAEAHYRTCLESLELELGPMSPETNQVALMLANVLSEQDLYSESIQLRKRELLWRRKENGDTDYETLDSILTLAIHLGVAGKLEEAEELFREAVDSCRLVLDLDDSMIGDALYGLAKTLRLVGRLEEASIFAKQALDHRLAFKGSDNGETNSARLNYAQILVGLGAKQEAAVHLLELQASMGHKEKPDNDDKQLMNNATELLLSIEEKP